MNIIDNNIFIQVNCLTEKSKVLSSDYLFKTWFKRSDSRYPGQTIQNFISYNQQMFDFLKIIPNVIGNGRYLELFFQTDTYVGAIPLLSASNGIQIGDFIVKPRYTLGVGAQYFEIFTLLDDDIPIEFIDSIPLKSSEYMKPPLFFDCIFFVNLFSKCISINWRKFSRNKKHFPFPKTQILWNDYLRYEWNPDKKIDFICSNNELSISHKDFSNLIYVYSIAKKEIFSIRTPISEQYNIKEVTKRIDFCISELQSQKCDQIRAHHSDPITIKKAKTIANRILNYNASETKAWRVDFSIVFEKYVQYIFKEVNRIFGGEFYENYKFQRSVINAPSWSLYYLEPDLIIKKDDFLVMIDAKYKSNLFNKNTRGTLYEQHRLDIHQLFSYCAFEKTKNKVGILCYPSTKNEMYKMHYSNNLADLNVTVGFLGIPIDKTKIESSKKCIYDFLEEEYFKFKDVE